MKCVFKFIDMFIANVVIYPGIDIFLSIKKNSLVNLYGYDFQ